MSVRLQEVHPSLVHYPIALLPLAIGADLAGRLTHSRQLLQVGKWAMAFTAGAAALTAASGLVAQQEVNVEGHALDVLITHRNLNLAVTGAAALMAARRFSERRPGAGYLAAGLAAIGAVAYSAYLGGHMVYELGVGVKAAGGTNPKGVPKLAGGQMAHAARVAGRDLVEGARTTVTELREGKLVPAMSHDGGASGQ